MQTLMLPPTKMKAQSLLEIMSGNSKLLLLVV
jgi:hypothetical protein